MSPWKSSVPAALLGIAIAAGGLYGTRHGRATEIARLRETNRKLRIAISATKPIAPVTTAEIPPTLPTKPAEPASPATPVDRGDYRFAGNATPQATLQTFAWACDKMDTELLAKLIYFDPAARTKAATFLAGLPEKIRAEWHTPEDLAAIGLADAMQQSRFPPAIILDHAELERVSDDRVILHLDGAAKDRTEYQRTDAGWKYVVTEKAVDRYLALLAPKAGK